MEHQEDMTDIIPTSAKPMKLRMKSSLALRLSKMTYIHMGRPDPQGIDFCSNDYLSLSNIGSPFQQFLAGSQLMKTPMPTSSTGARLLSGNTNLAESLEEVAAKFHRGQAALLFNSGFDANLALLSCVLDKEDCFVFDELVHASMHDGMRLSRSKERPIPFSHNSVDSMREAVLSAAKRTGGNVLVCVESIYSMDGDVCPLVEMLTECERLAAALGRDVNMLVDEAHSAGLFGAKGEGFVVHKNLHDHPNLLARVITYGKGHAAHGAMIVCDDTLRNYLYNYGRPFLFSTALSPHSVATLIAMYEFMETDVARTIRETMWKRVSFFKKVAQEKLPRSMLLPTMGDSPIQVLMVGDDFARGVALVKELIGSGFEVYGIGAPAVARGMERIRVIVHAGNSEQQIESLIETITSFLDGYESTYVEETP